VRGIAVVTPRLITREMVAGLVEEMGGTWFKDSEVPSGSIERGSSAVFIYLPRPVDFTIFESEQIIELRRLIGAEPVSYLELGFASDEGSVRLGYDFAATLIAKWGGIIETGDGAFLAAGKSN
jgi:hypothetical protein